MDAQLGGDQVHAAGERLKPHGLPPLRRERKRPARRGRQRSPGPVVPRAADRVQDAVRADTKSVAQLGLRTPAQLPVRRQRPEVRAAVAGRRFRIDGVEIDGAVSPEREVSNVEVRAEPNRAGRMCRRARPPDQQPVIEDVEQPDRSVACDVERHRSTRSVHATAAGPTLLEADLVRPGLGNDSVRRPEVTELMRPQRHRHPFDRRSRCRPERDRGEEEGQADDRQHCCSPCIHDDSFRLIARSIDRRGKAASNRE